MFIRSEVPLYGLAMRFDPGTPRIASSAQLRTRNALAPDSPVASQTLGARIGESEQNCARHDGEYPEVPRVERPRQRLG